MYLEEQQCHVTTRVFPGLLVLGTSYGNVAARQHAWSVVTGEEAEVCLYVQGEKKMLIAWFSNWLVSEKVQTVCLPPWWQQQGQTTHGPTYSMARAIQATTWQNGFICRCHYLRFRSQWRSHVTWTDLSNGHINEGCCMS